jgi:hypothetical protein
VQCTGPLKCQSSKITLNVQNGEFHWATQLHFLFSFFTRGDHPDDQVRVAIEAAQASQEQPNSKPGGAEVSKVKRQLHHFKTSSTSVVSPV